MSTVSAFIGTSGRVMFFLLGDGTPASIWTSQSSDPTYRIGDGPPIPLTGRTAYPITAGFGPSYVHYPLAEKIKPTDTVTYSSPAGWVSFGDSDTAPAATDAPVTNQSGQEMFPIEGPHTLELGMNTWGPSPLLPTDLCRNQLKNTNGGGGVVTSDVNFVPTAISGDAWWNIQNRSTDNGIDALGTGGRAGTYWVTWKDYSPGRDKLAWIVAHDVAQTIVTAVGSKLTIETTGSYTKYRQQYDLQFAPGAVSNALGFNLYFNSVDVKDMEVVDPLNDPDSTEVVNAYFKSACAGVSAVRFLQATEGINSNAATYAQCRQRGDVGGGLYHLITAQITQVEAISNHTVRWNGETFTVDKWTLMGTPNTDPTSVVGLYCTTLAPHGFDTLQNLDLRGLYNLNYTRPTDAADHCGVQVNGISGPIWMSFRQESQVVCYVVDDTHFIVYPAYIVTTAGIADPTTTQTFDTSNGRSTVSTFSPLIGTISYPEAIQAAGEMGATAHIAFGECMTDQAMHDAAVDCLATFQALGAGAPPFIDLELGDEHWNPGWSLFYRLGALSRVIGHGVVPGAIRQCQVYLANRLLTAFKDVFAAAGLGDRVRRGLWFQRFGDVELQYAQANGMTFEVGGCSSYYFPTYPSGAWEAYDVEQWHDLWEWVMNYIVVGQSTAMLANIAQYMPDMYVAAYEGGCDEVSPGPFDTARVRDWYYHPRNYSTTLQMLANAERAGFDRVNLYTFSHSLNIHGTAWPHAMAQGQVAGLGLSNVTSAGKGPKVNQDLTNKNTKMKAVQDWLGNTSSTPTPTPTPSPTLRRIYVDPDRVSIIVS